MNSSNLPGSYLSRRVFGTGVAAAVLTPAFLRSSAAAASDFPNSGLVSVVQTSTSTHQPGLQVSHYDVVATHGASKAHLFTVDLRISTTNLLCTKTIAWNQRLDDMAEDAGAIAAVNADFFQNSVEHAGVPATFAPVGVEILDGKILKSAVPEGQRYGGTMPNPENRGNEVIGVQRNGRGAVTRIELDAFINNERIGKIAVNGLNIYGMDVNQITAFDHRWGRLSRQRVACGTNRSRRDVCSTDVVEVILTNNKVTSISPTIGAGQLGEKQLAIVGREQGAAKLRQLQVGDEVASNFRGVAENGNKFDWAVAGGIFVKDGALTANISNQPGEPRTYAGVDAAGETMYLLTIDGRDNVSKGISTRDGADLVRHLGAHDGVLLDGGGSSTMIARDGLEGDWELLNRSRVSGIEVLRYIPNGIGIFPY
ncbi:phosphodiester glycosidase family protein [Propionibacteriaceae bacterium G1746]|uniref:phosphodiester glycosidase family protein n=1 Tax=Aestuariimicrobium sp. G57 TaxID=3418485 RepID=UPI003C25E040